MVSLWYPYFFTFANVRINKSPILLEEDLKFLLSGRGRFFRCRSKNKRDHGTDDDV